MGFLIFLAVAGLGLASFGEIASHASQREKEAELLFRGNQFREGIASYYKKEQRYPHSLEQLLEDKRYPMPVRHLRKLYRDPTYTPAFTNVPIRTEELAIELTPEEAEHFDSLRLPLYGNDDGAALRDLLFTWWEERYLAANSGAPAIGD